MAKKKKKKLKKKSGLISKKKIRRWLMRLFLIAAGAAIGVLARPSLIQDPVKRAQVESIREQVLDANDVAQEKTLQVLGESSQVAQEVVNKASEFTSDVIHKDPEAVVEKAVADLKNEVKSIPEAEVKKIKLQFCEDIIEEMEATDSHSD